VAWDELVVVDRDERCAVAALPPHAHPPGMRLVVSDWHEYFAEFLALAAEDGARRGDAIVPSPLMPHLIADWLLEPARSEHHG
jgi:hypothetical protein